MPVMEFVGVHGIFVGEKTERCWAVIGRARNRADILSDFGYLLRWVQVRL